MLKKRASRSDLSFRELKIYYAEKGFHVDDASFEANFNLRNKDGDYNLLEVVIYYHNKKAYTDMLKNLVKVIGQDELIQRTGNKSIVFKQS